MSDENTANGQFVTRKKTRPAIKIDCSDWVDTSTGDWFFGSFVTKKKTRPAIKTEFHLDELDNFRQVVEEAKEADIRFGR